MPYCRLLILRISKKPRLCGVFFIRNSSRMRHRYFALWLALLLTPNFLWTGIADDSLDSAIRSIPPSLVILTTVYAWTKNPRWPTILLTPFYFLLPFEIFYLASYGQPTNSLVLGIVDETNPREAIEYVGLVNLVIIFTVSIILVILNILISLRAKVLPQHRALTWIAWAGLIPFIQLAWLEWDDIHREGRVNISQTASLAGGEILMTAAPSPTEESLMSSYPLGIPFRISEYLNEKENIMQEVSRLNKFNYKIQSTSLTNRSETYVLIIGESARSDHWGINGYQRDTTPNIGQFPRIASFQNVTTAWPATRMAVPLILVGFEDEHHQVKRGRGSIIQLYKQAGFHTYWISNQAPLGFHDSIVSVYAKQADNTFFINSSGYSKRGSYDEELIPIFQRKLTDPYQKKFFVIHLMGSHKKYSHRYPPSFRPSFLDSVTEPATSHKAIIDEYDTSIAYTDRILGAFIKELQRTEESKSALLYVSDHGETLPKNGCTDSGHGYGNEPEFRVASFLWLSKELDAQEPTILQRAISKKNAPLQSIGVLHTFADISGIEFPEKDMDASWVSTSLKHHSRWTNMARDFDHAKRKPPCDKLSEH